MVRMGRTSGGEVEEKKEKKVTHSERMGMEFVVFVLSLFSIHSLSVFLQ